MDEPNADRETVVRTRNRRECRDARLVLDSAGIASEVGNEGGFWTLTVANADISRANDELEAFRRENPRQPKRPPEKLPVYGGAWAGVIGYATVILLVGGLSANPAYHESFFAVGQMQAGRVLAGEWWRTVTALTLHLDVQHIGGNLVFGTVFGLLAGRVLGGGVAWLAIVIAGALGNLVNALVQDATHTSIGASTAVFAALGVIVAHALRTRRDDRDKPLLKRWSPLIGGLVLLGYTGVGGERTDVAAHGTGFLAGLFMGWIGCRLPHSWLSNRIVQTTAGVLAVAIVFVAWGIGIATTDIANQ